LRGHDGQRASAFKPTFVAYRGSAPAIGDLLADKSICCGTK